MGHLIFEVSGAKKQPWRTQGIVYEDQRFVEFNIFLTDELYPQDRSSWVSELAGRMNDTVPAGAWIYRYCEMDVRLRVVRTFQGAEPISPEPLIHLLSSTAFPLRLWDKAFAYRFDDGVSPQVALQASLVAEGAYDGRGLSKASRKAIMAASVASGFDPIPVGHRLPAKNTLLLL